MLTLKQARRMVAKSRRRVWRFYRERGTPISPPQGTDPTGYALWMAEDPMHHHSCTGRAFVPVVEEFRRRFDALNRMEALASERAWQMAVYRAAIQVSPIDGAPIIGLTDDFTIETIELPALDHGQDGDELLQDIVEYYADSRACVVCGAEMDWIECDHCGGEGGFASREAGRARIVAAAAEGGRIVAAQADARNAEIARLIGERGWTVREVARALGLTENAVCARWRRYQKRHNR